MFVISDEGRPRMGDGDNNGAGDGPESGRSERPTQLENDRLAMLVNECAGASVVPANLM